MQDDKKREIKYLGKYIKKLRTYKKWNLEKLSTLAGCCPSSLSRIEQGKSEPKYSTLKNISEAFHYNLAEFITELENFKRNNNK